MPSCEQEPGQEASLCSGLIEEDKLTSSCHNMKWTLFNFPPLPLASSACFTPAPLEACRGMPPVSSPLADTEIAAILCARPGDYDSYLLSGCFPLSCLLAGKPSRGGDPGPRERCQVWASNLRCCLSRLNDSFETHLLDAGAKRETEREMERGKPGDILKECDADLAALVSLLFLFFPSWKCVWQQYLQSEEFLRRSLC